MISSNKIRYSNLVNFAFVDNLAGVAINSFDPRLSNRMKIAAGIAGLGAAGAGYYAINSEQNAQKERLRKLASLKSESERQLLADEYTKDNPALSAAGSDLRRTLLPVAGALGGAMIGVAGIGAYNKLKGKSLTYGY